LISVQEREKEENSKREKSEKGEGEKEIEKLHCLPMFARNSFREIPKNGALSKVLLSRNGGAFPIISDARWDSIPGIAILVHL